MPKATWSFKKFHEVPRRLKKFQEEPSRFTKFQKVLTSCMTVHKIYEGSRRLERCTNVQEHSGTFKNILLFSVFKTKVDWHGTNNEYCW